MVRVSLCRLGRNVPAPFALYLLPEVRRLLLSEEDGDGFTVLGALWDTAACAAAAVRWTDGGGTLLSLFVDPAARSHGIAGRLVDLLLEEASLRGARFLRCCYILRGGELAAMDALLLRRGGELVSGAPVYGMDSRDFRDSPLLGQALRPLFQADAHIVTFSSLTGEQLAALEGEPTYPAFLRPSARRDAADPGLSVAWVEDGFPVACVLGVQSGEDMFDQTSAWRGPAAPAGSFRSLVAAQLNRCWYRCGGDFRFFLSPVNEASQRLFEWFSGGTYERYAQREAVLRVP